VKSFAGIAGRGCVKVRPYNGAYSLRWCAPRGSNLARSARSNEIAASEVPAPVLGHPAVGGAVARYVADAWERQVIPEEQDTVGCRLIEQSPS
jgi:hypothetical protein